ETRDRKPVTLADVKATGAMTVLLKDALQPNLVQTLEGNPALIHGGPFANIAHGCNSVIATRAGLKLGDYVVTEAGFGADLVAEKFIDIKCRQAGLKPSAVVIVATVRALKMHGGVSKKELGSENLDALEQGFANLARHVENVRGFGLPVVIGVNHFYADTDAEHAKLKELCRDRLQVEAITCKHWAEGGAGAEELAQALVRLSEGEQKPLTFAYETDTKLTDKIKTIATKLYG
ncbi:formate--tetrahydrofolate ligase, partial [Methylobacterium radiotolerans]|uniref:formate--tetrahydrofolate ligase n=1 Tax=Methylobacterium radiotolerans TaxID=31998 RepID=UPI0009D249B4